MSLRLPPHIAQGDVLALSAIRSPELWLQGIGAIYHTDRKGVGVCRCLAVLMPGDALLNMLEG